jgi:hypothetical protein
MKRILKKIVRRIVSKGKRAPLLFGRNPIPRDPMVLMDRARQQTGLSDFGPEVFIEGYKKLHYSLRYEAELHRQGRKETARLLLTLLRNRLLIEGSKKKYPDVSNENILRPVFIVGLPRTGSTFLQRLIAADPAWHHLIFEEAVTPAPPSALSPELAASRREEVEIFCRYIFKHSPQVQLMHAMKPDSPEECYLLMRNNFMSMSFRWFGSIPTYMEWLGRQDKTHCCQEYQYQLKLLQYGRGAKRWILKAPSHWTYLPTLLDTFPDASLMITHRDPKDVLKSWVKLETALKGLYTTQSHIDGNQSSTFGETFRRHMDSLQEVREQRADTTTLDIPYKNFTSNPMETVKAVYEAMDQPLTKDSEEELLKFLEKDDKDRKSRPKLSRKQVNIDEGEVDALFAAYLGRLKSIEENFPA